MKERINIKTIGCCLMMLVTLLGFSACNNEDDVMEIFNNKTWKLTRLTTEGSSKPLYPELLNEENLKVLENKENFTMNFNIAEIDGEAMGTVKIHGIQSNIEDASTKIDGKAKTLSINGKMSGSETNGLAKFFMNNIQGSFKYDGSSLSLTLYFKDGQTTKVMGFVPLK